jgi:MYXO-CTERM domain-containing protein
MSFFRRLRLMPAGCTLALAGVSLVADAPDAQACGGCFHMPPAVQAVSTVVTDHRMAFSLSTTQSVLWDQIHYTGNPAEFAWVLPVKSGASIELSQDAWMAALDASTQTVIQGPNPNCTPPSGGVGCGGSSASGFAASGNGGGGGVTVVSQSVVGPYDAVTVKASQGQALGDWLRANGYNVSVAVQPVIDAYTAEGFDFIALKLRPGEGVQAMQPVRVVTQGADPSLPLRMVAAGVGPNVGIVLFVLSEGRYHPQNFPDATIDFTQLKWDGAANISNYETLATAAMAAGGGRSWLTESSAPADLSTNYYGNYGNGNNPPLGAALSACSTLTLPPAPGCTSAGDASDEASMPISVDSSAEAAPGSDAMSEAGDDGSGTWDAMNASEAATESGTASPEASTSMPPMSTEGGVCAATMVPCDDLQVAMTGITPGNLWVTRLRAFLPASALARDLILEASPTQDQVPSFHQTNTYTDPSYKACPDSGGCECRASETPRSRFADAFVLGVGAVVLGASLRRRRRR